MFTEKDITLFNGDCLKVMDELINKGIKVDMILADLPYGTTSRNKWDVIIPLDELWERYLKIIKDNGAILLFAQTPFDKILGCSNLKHLRYEWIWEKTTPTGHLNANKMPMKAHENILVFYKKLPVYNPQKTKGHPPIHSYTKHKDDSSNYGITKAGISGGGSTERYPRSVQVFKWDKQKCNLHPTQKPVSLLEFLIKTYTNENDLVLDNCMGSCSTGIACINTSRRFIGIELEQDYFNISVERIHNALEQQKNITDCSHP